MVTRFKSRYKLPTEIQTVHVYIVFNMQFTLYLTILNYVNRNMPLDLQLYNLTNPVSNLNRKFMISILIMRLQNRVLSQLHVKLAGN